MAKRGSRGSRADWKARQQALQQQKQATQQLASRLFPRTVWGAGGRVPEAIGGLGEEVDDWEYRQFDSSRCLAARYSPSREELHMSWVNQEQGPPYPPYIYDSVDRPTWDLLQQSGSPGRFVATTLDNYPYRPAPELYGQI